MKRAIIGILALILITALARLFLRRAPTQGRRDAFTSPGRCPASRRTPVRPSAGGVRLMAEQLNRSGGLLGYKVKVVALDDEADSDVAAGVAEQIKEAVDRGDRVIGVIGHPNSGQTAAAMDIYKDLAIIVITPTASEVALTQQGYRNFFRVNAANDLAGETGADYLVSKLGAQKVAVLLNDDPYGIDLGKLVAADLTHFGAAGAAVAPGEGRAESLPVRSRQDQGRGCGRDLLCRL